MCSVPPKAEGESKDASASKADDEEKPKPPQERLQEAVRDSKVTFSLSLRMLTGFLSYGPAALTELHVWLS